MAGAARNVVEKWERERGRGVDENGGAEEVVGGGRMGMEGEVPVVDDAVAASEGGGGSGRKAHENG